MTQISLRQLRAVVAVNRHKKIVSAAKALGVTQPAVTLQLRDLEASIGLPVFERSAEGMRPTAAGMAVLQAALAIEEKLRGLDDDINAIKGIRKGLLRLGVVSTAKYFAPAIIAAFKKRYPDLEITLFVGNRDETLLTLRTHGIDAAIMGRPPRDMPLRGAAFGEHPLVVITNAEHPLAGARAVSKSRIAREHFLVRERGSGTRSSLELFFSDVPERVEQLGTEMGSNETIKQAVIAGLGVALISAHTIAQEVQLGRLVVADVEGMPIRRQWYLVSRTDAAQTPSLKAFEDFLLAEGTHFLPTTLEDAAGLPRP